MEKNNDQRMCPFCPVMLPDQPDLWSPIGNDFFGTPTSIGNIRSCGWCAEFVGIGDDIPGNTLYLLQHLAHPQSVFFASLAEVARYHPTLIPALEAPANG